jgi:hypothetical protein
MTSPIPPSRYITTADKLRVARRVWAGRAVDDPRLAGAAVRLAVKSRESLRARRIGPACALLGMAGVLVAGVNEGAWWLVALAAVVATGNLALLIQLGPGAASRLAAAEAANRDLLDETQ